MYDNGLNPHSPRSFERATFTVPALEVRDNTWSRLNAKVDSLVAQRDAAPASDRASWQAKVDDAIDEFETVMDGFSG